MSNTQRALAFMAALMMAAGTAAWAQSPAPKTGAAAPSLAKITADLRAISDTDFTFLLFRDPLLYPETAVSTNPSVAAGFGDTFVSGVLDLPYTRTDTTLTRADDSVGQKGGTSRSTNDLLAPTVSVMSLFPSVSKKAPLVDGLFGNATLDYQRAQTQNTNYDSISQSQVTTKLTWPLSAAVGGLVAGGKRNSGWGVSATYNYTMDLHSYETIENVVGATKLTTYANALNPADVFTHDLDVRLGARFPLSRSTSLGLAVQLGAGLKDASTAYIAADSNGDGTPDTVMTLHDYYLSPKYQSPVPASYDRVDRTWRFRASLSPDLRIALQDGLEVFLDGTWKGLDLDYNTYWQHILYSSSATDASIETSILDNGLRSGEVMLGVAFGNNLDSLLKIGVGYRRIDQELSEDGVDSAGNNVYSTINPNHYPEYSLGAAPRNNLIVDMVASNGLPPWSDVTDAILLSAGYERKVSTNLRFFAGLQGELFHQEQDWYVFNLDTRTVWKETATVNEAAWDVKAIAGLAFDLDRNVVFTLDCAGTGVSGNFTGSSETLPYDSTAGTETTNGSVNTTSSAPLTLRLHAGLSFRY
jgi:hypothetical protein